MKTFLLLGEDQYFYETLKKQVELNERFLLHFSALNKAASSFSQIQACSLLFLDIPFFMTEEDFDYGMLKDIPDVPLITFTKNNYHIQSSNIQKFLFNKTIVKPFKMSRLENEIDGLLSESSDKLKVPIKIGKHLFLEDEKLLVDPDDRKKIRLTEKETAILMKLSRANGESVSRKTLLEEVWGYKAGINSHTLETHIYRLRKKIEGSDSSSPFLKTSRNGYMLLFNAN